MKLATSTPVLKAKLVVSQADPLWTKGLLDTAESTKNLAKVSLKERENSSQKECVNLTVVRCSQF